MVCEKCDLVSGSFALVQNERRGKLVCKEVFFGSLLCKM